MDAGQRGHRPPASRRPGRPARHRPVPPRTAGRVDASELSEQQRAAIDYHVAPDDRIAPATWAIGTRDPEQQRRCAYSAHIGLRRSVAQNQALTTDLVAVVDLVGVFDDSTLTGGLRFRAITPRRIVDTRGGLGIPAALGANRTATVAPPAAVAPADTNALALNVTAVAPTANTFLTVWPSDRARPFVSNLNPTAGRNIPNAVIAGLGSGRAFNVYNSVGSTHVLVDVVGRFWLHPGTAGGGSPITRSAGPATARVFSGSPVRAP